MLIEKISGHPGFGTMYASMRLEGLHIHVMGCALQGEERAMMRGDLDAAMEFLEVAIGAREGAFGVSAGPSGFEPLRYIDPIPFR